MSLRTCLCLFAATVASANGEYTGGCPFLRKVVPQGQFYVDMASEFLHLRATDCAAYAEMYAEHLNYTHGNFEGHSQADMKAHCSSRQIPATWTPSLASIFPAFTDNGMLFHLQVGSYPAVAQVHFCSKTKKITSANVISTEAPAPESAKQLGSLILKKIFQEHDCSVLADLMEEESSVAFHGDASALTRGQENAFGSASLARAFCDAKAAKEKRIHIQDAVVINKYFYDGIRKELVLVGDRSVEVMFAPGKVLTHPIAASLKISPAGKVSEVRFYETDVMHIERKYGSIPSYPAHHIAHEAHKNIETPIKASLADRKESIPFEENSAAFRDTVAKKMPSNVLEGTVLSSISGATGARSGPWCQMAMLLLSITFAHL